MSPGCGRVGGDGMLFHGLLDDLEFDRCADWFPARRFEATFHEVFDTGFGEILLPAPNRGLGDANLVHDRHDAITIRCHEDDSCAFDDLLWCVSIANQPLQLQASLPLEYESQFIVFHSRSKSPSPKAFKCL